ncbi:MAG: UxaA family hydrolase [Armatimonadota bacterium]
MAVVELGGTAVLLCEDDDVAVAKTRIPCGTVLAAPNRRVTAAEDIPAGHKLALRDLPTDAPVRKYGHIIGFTIQPVTAGQWVHTHNLAAGTLQLVHEFGADAKPIQMYPPEQRRTFQGYRRPDGRVGTRNYVAVIPTVSCSAGTANRIAARARESILQDFPNVDGVVALTHKGGCGTASRGADHRILQRVLAGFADHPNVAAALFVGLGCEVNDPALLLRDEGLVPSRGRRRASKPISVLTIQQCGGVQQTVERGVKELEKLLRYADQFRRTAVPVSELVVATNCGGSDAWSGITANPALGMTGDELVRHGGTWVLGETTETYGAEHLLTRRAASREVGEKLVALMRWWERYAEALGAEIDNNPSPGNIQGGITTIYEKSLGAVTKGGSTPLNAVYEYAERIRHKGLCFMDTPGFDPVSVTGLVAGGCTVVAFTTGRGSCLGFKPAPCIKIASNTLLFESMSNDMDIDAGIILSGTPMQEVATAIFDEIIQVASGKRTKSELQDLGDEEFAPWTVGPVL